MCFCCCCGMFVVWPFVALNYPYDPTFRKSTTEFLMMAANGQKQVSLCLYHVAPPLFISANVLSLSCLV